MYDYTTRAGLAVLPAYTLQGVTVYVTANVRDVYVVDDQNGAELINREASGKDEKGGSKWK